MWSLFTSLQVLLFCILWPRIHHPANLYGIIFALKSTFDLEALPKDEFVDWFAGLIAGERTPTWLQYAHEFGVFAYIFIGTILLSALVMIFVAIAKCATHPQFKKAVFYVRDMFFFKMIIRSLLAALLSLCYVMSVNLTGSDATGMQRTFSIIMLVVIVGLTAFIANLMYKGSRLTEYTIIRSGKKSMEDRHRVEPNTFNPESNLPKRKPTQEYWYKQDGAIVDDQKPEAIPGLTPNQDLEGGEADVAEPSQQIEVKIKRNEEPMWLEKKETRKRIGNLYTGIAIDKQYATQYITLFFIRRLIIAFIVASTSFFWSYHVTTLSCVLTLMYLITVKPFIQRIDNYIEIFNEAMLLAFVYLEILNGGMVYDVTVWYNLGWVEVSLPLFQISVVLVITLIRLVKDAIIEYKKYQVKKILKNRQSAKVTHEDSARNAINADNSLPRVEEPV